MFMFISKLQQNRDLFSCRDLVNCQIKTTNTAHHTHTALFPSVVHVRCLSRGTWLCVATPPVIPPEMKRRCTKTMPFGFS
jgi:hypothetical protein